MINKKRLLANLADKKAILEYTLAALGNMSDDKRKANSIGIPAFYKYISQGPDGQTWTNWSVPSQSNAGTNYRVIVELHMPSEGGFIAFSKQKLSAPKMVKAVSSTDVRVYCSCPDFYWGGAKYNLGPSGKYGSEEMSLVPGQTAGFKHDQGIVTYAPDIRDPERKQVLCKHCISVSKKFPWNANQIFKDAVAYNPVVAMDAAITTQMDEGWQPLEKDIQFIEIPHTMEDDILYSVQEQAESEAKINAGLEQGSDELIDEQNSVVVPNEDEEASATIGANELIDEQNDNVTDQNRADNATEVIDKNNLATDVEEQSVIGADELINEENDQAIKPSEKGANLLIAKNNIINQNIKKPNQT